MGSVVWAFASRDQGHETDFLEPMVTNHLTRCLLSANSDDNDVRRKANLRWGVMPFRFDFAEDLETNIQLAFTFLKARGLAQDGDNVVLVSDLKTLRPDEKVKSVQVRRIN